MGYLTTNEEGLSNEPNRWKVVGTGRPLARDYEQVLVIVRVEHVERCGEQGKVWYAVNHLESMIFCTSTGGEELFV